MQPVRHAMGALLLEQGRAADAEVAYREDLGRRCAAAGTDPSGQSVGAAQAARLPGAAGRDRGGRADPPACALRRRPRRRAGVLLLREGVGMRPPALYGRADCAIVGRLGSGGFALFRKGYAHGRTTPGY